MKRTRKIMLASLVSFLSFAALSYTYRVGISTVWVSLDVHQGDLVLAGNNVTIVEEQFNMNGSIIITENATLILQNAIVNFTQAIGRQFNMTLENPANGNPRLLTYNSTITSSLDFLIYLYGNSTATVNNSTVSRYLSAYDNSAITVLNSSYVNDPRARGSSQMTVYDSTLAELHNYDSPQVEVHNSRINNLVIGSTTVNCTVSNLEAGNMSYWNFLTNCSVAIIAGGYCPNVTFVNTEVNGWRFAFYGSSDAVVVNSTLEEASAVTGSCVLHLSKSAVSYAYCASSCTLWTDDTLIDSLYAGGLSTAWLLNTTYNDLNIQDSARVHIGWYLAVHVVDLLHQDVPSANVTAQFLNGTIANSGTTDPTGRTTLILEEKMTNATGEYPVGNYTITATYLTHSNETSVNMTKNDQIELALEDLVVPEFTYCLILPLFVTLTLLTITFRRKETRGRHLHL